MFDESHIYDLAFQSPDRKLGTAPELIFIINRLHLPELQQRLWRITYTSQATAERYHKGAHVLFTLPEPDLFGNKEFGYGRCGYYTEEGNDVWLRIQLGPGDRTYHCALTIHMLTQALGAPFDTVVPSNQGQQFMLETLADNFRTQGWGHQVGGYLCEPVIAWLQTYAKNEGAEGEWGSVPLPAVVLKAMRETWYTTNTGKGRSWASDIRGYIRASGHFTLICFGNACDLALYPEQPTHVGCEFSYVGCHNLDTAWQQLTLLAGMAKLCELARSSD